MKAPSSKAAGPVVDWNYVFLLFWSQLVISKEQRFPCYTTFTLHFSHSILTRPLEEGLSVTDQKGNNILTVFLSFVFLGKK